MGDELDPKALWSCSYGLYVVTSRFGEEVNGQIGNTVFQVAADPPRVAVALNRENYTHELVSKSGVFSVTVLAESTPMKFIGRFGFKDGRGFDKLAGVEHVPGVTGCPCVTENGVSMFEARVFGTLDAGTHTVFAGDVVSAKVLSDDEPLTYARYHANKGRAPKNSPTYRAERIEEKKKGDASMKRYVCDVCGYVYDPAEGDSESNIPAGTAFEDLPEDWVCPVCGASKDEFSPED